MRKIMLLSVLCLVIGCAERQPKATEDVVSKYHERYELMRQAMERGDINEAQRLSNETNSWLESLSDDEQMLISKSLTK